MLGQVHAHIVSELGQSSRTDTIFVVTAVVFNLIVLGINSGVAGSAVGQENGLSQVDLILAVFIGMSMLVNGLAITALNLGKQTRVKLLNGLLAMYRDNDVDRYYDSSLLGNYSGRYLLLTGVILSLAVTAIIVPLIIRTL